MGQQAKMKIARATEKKARAGTIRLHMVEIKAQLVAYDEYGRAMQSGSGAVQPIYLMEAEVPEALVVVIREKYPKLEFVTIEPAPAEEN